MHSRLCMYLYVCQHKIELTHTWRERDTPFLLQSSIALIERIWNLSFFLLFSFVLPLLLFSYICIVRFTILLHCVPFHLFISTVLLFCCQRFTSRNNHFKPILVLKYSYLCTHSEQQEYPMHSERYEWSVVCSVLDSYAWWWWETTHVHSCIFYTISIDSSPSNCLLHFAKNRQTWLLVYIAMAHMAFKVHRKLSSAHYYYWVCCYHYVSKYSA